LFISSPNTDGFYSYILQGSAATQLRCGGSFSNHFAANFPHNAPVKKFFRMANTWQRYGQVCGLLFWPPCTMRGGGSNVSTQITQVYIGLPVSQIDVIRRNARNDIGLTSVIAA